MKLSKFTTASATDVELSPEAEALVEQVKLRAENLFETRALLCGEAVLLTLNEAFNGPLSEEEAIKLGATFCMGVGNAGCMCGALAGGLASVGLFTANGKKAVPNGHARDCGRVLHDSFVERHRSSCCRILTKHVKDDSQKHFAQCTMLTGDATQLAARIIIEERGGNVEAHNAMPALSKYTVAMQRIWNGAAECVNRIFFGKIVKNQ